MKENIFISHSIYTLYLSIILSRKKEDSFILYLNDSNLDQKIEEKIMMRVKKLEWVKDIAIINSRDINTLNRKYNKYFLTKCIRIFIFNGVFSLSRKYIQKRILKNTKEKYGCQNYQSLIKMLEKMENKKNKVFVGLDITLFFRNFIGYNFNYEIFEDGEVTYTENKNKRRIPNFILKLLNIYKYCQNPKIEKINVLWPERLSPKLKSKAIKMDIEEVFSNEIVSQKIYNCFLDTYFNFKNKTIMILTQCFYQHQMIDTKREQIEVYKKIVKQYENKYNIILKPHPSDYINYEELDIKNLQVLPNYFPVEILDFNLITSKYKFEKIIAISSTAISNFKSAVERLNIGEDKIEEIKK